MWLCDTIAHFRLSTGTQKRSVCWTRKWNGNCPMYWDTTSRTLVEENSKFRRMPYTNCRRQGLQRNIAYCLKCRSRTSDVEIGSVWVGNPDAILGNTFVFAFVRFLAPSYLQWTCSIAKHTKSVTRSKNVLIRFHIYCERAHCWFLLSYTVVETIKR